VSCLEPALDDVPRRQQRLGIVCTHEPHSSDRGAFPSPYSREKCFIWPVVLSRSPHIRMRASGAQSVAFIEASLAQVVHHYSPLLHQSLSTPALQSRTRCRTPHKPHSKQVSRSLRCRIRTPTTRLRPVTPPPNRSPKQ
jgi:hypothetical protein